MQVGIDIGCQSDGYRLTVGGYSGDGGRCCFGNESDGYRLTVGGFSGDGSRCWYW